MPQCVGKITSMVTQIDKRESRQAEYIKRSRKARFYARILMPITLVALATGVWSDPVWGPRVVEGVEEIKPMVASYLQETPFSDVMQQIELKKPVENAVDDVEERIEASLPMSLRPILRP